MRVSKQRTSRTTHPHFQPWAYKGTGPSWVIRPGLCSEFIVPQRALTLNHDVSQEKWERTKGDHAADLSTVDLSKVLKDFVSSKRNSTFTCSGSISLADIKATFSSGSTASAPNLERKARKRKRKTGRKEATSCGEATTAVSVSGAIVVRWDRPDGLVTKVRFPVAEADVEAFENLVRKAGAMDKSRFSTNVCPYTLGIVKSVVQILLPNAAGMGPVGVEDGGLVRAELYKLNVYKGPSGFFKSHVDTPRGETQFGSLVMCIPSPRKGGKLTVTDAEQDPVAQEWDGTKGAKAL